MRQITFLFFLFLFASITSRAQEPNYNKANKAYYVQGNYEKSLRLYQKLIDKNLLDSYAQNGKGLSLYSLERYDEALSCFNWAIMFNPEEWTFYINRANCYSVQSKFELALKDLNYVIDEDPHMALAYQSRAYVYYNQDNMKAALEDINEAMELGLRNAECYYYRAATYAVNGELELSEKDYKRSLELDPEAADVHYYYATLLFFNLGKLEESIVHYKEAIELGFNDESAYFSLGVAYGETKQNRLAEEAYTKSIKLNSDSSSSFFNRGTVRAYLQDYEGALEDYSRALELQPAHIGALTNRALFVYDAQGEYDQAIADFRKIIDIYEASGLNPAYGYNNLGYMLYKKGQLTEALRNVEYSLELDSENSYAYRNLALIYIALEDYESACNSAEKAIEMGFIEDYGSEITEIRDKACL